MKLENDRTYKAVLSLGLFKRMASNETVAAKLTEAGFGSVQVTGSGGTRYASGVWLGATQEVDDLPSEIESVTAV